MFEPLLSFCDDADQCNSSGELLLNQTFDEEDEEEMLAEKPSFWNECMQEIVALQRRNERSKRELQAERDKSQLLSRLTWEVSSVSHGNAPSFMAYIRFFQTYRVERWVSSYAFSRWKEKSRRARVSEKADMNVALLAGLALHGASATSEMGTEQAADPPPLDSLAPVSLPPMQHHGTHEQTRLVLLAATSAPRPVPIVP
ncbi:hypothetical protein GUITHDRAFT_122211 [Guillardia theta CCMP2712]|uniref:Uncharacterized protein n=1 Tax=Guillardia theta (strain CCMP2712) TaxID=905079 RepID=L1I5T6_GUITC|nr:hypothetical protein GUITHDRAFT_122211 [Guillardia theta CCMP2712]EKX31606.1 hypothetical protein GUITHDRAFT_122211 [Guillardia theta CCMP2712]|eukprot:XP_005818586.1 hypothetical protein GUITHDRAFT_122211 [Guillardia theta CCMP2712]